MNYKGIEIECLRWATFKIKSDKIIYIDPWQVSGDKADLILITHDHFDHCDPETIGKLKKEETVILASEEVKKKIPEARVMKPGDTEEIFGIKIKAVESYNLIKKFHPRKARNIGFILDVGEVKIYHAGDTDVIPEMKNFECDIALLPVGGTYVMNVEQAIEALKIIKPHVVCPMHYGSTEQVTLNADINKFKKEAEKLGIDVLT